MRILALPLLLLAACEGELTEQGTLVVSGLDHDAEDIGDMELSSMVVTVEAMYLSPGIPESDSDWEVVFESEEGTEIDLITGEGELSGPLSVGNHKLVFLKIAAGFTFQRAGEGCGEESNTAGEGSIATVLSIPDVLSDSFGQEVSEDSFEILSEPDIPPSAVHPEANDAYFWVIADPVEVTPGAEVELAFTALPGSIEASEGCGDVPGKPIFVLGAPDVLSKATGG